MIAKKSRGYLESAVRKLGPERAYDALRAFENDPARGGHDDGSWDTCVLARAYGPSSELAGMGDTEKAKRTTRRFATQIVADLMGLTDREVIAVVRSYDGDWGEGYAELLKYLLVKEAGKLATPPAESFALCTASAGLPNGETK